MTSGDITLLDLHISSDDTQPHSITINNYGQLFFSYVDFFEFISMNWEMDINFTSMFGENLKDNNYRASPKKGKKVTDIPESPKS